MSAALKADTVICTDILARAAAAPIQPVLPERLQVRFGAIAVGAGESISETAAATEDAQAGALGVTILASQIGVEEPAVTATFVLWPRTTVHAE